LASTLYHSFDPESMIWIPWQIIDFSGNTDSSSLVIASSSMADARHSVYKNPSLRGASVVCERRSNPQLRTGDCFGPNDGPRNDSFLVAAQFAAACPEPSDRKAISTVARGDCHREDSWRCFVGRKRRSLLAVTGPVSLVAKQSSPWSTWGIATARSRGGLQ
jgi:hypothetical protein